MIGSLFFIPLSGKKCTKQQNEDIWDRNELRGAQ